MLQNRKAFTLIEVIVVASIIMILASIIVAGVRGAQKKAFKLQCLSNIKTLGQVTLLYSDETLAGTLPSGFNLLYDPVDFNDLSVYICPNQREKDLSISNNLPYTFTDTSNISYNFVNDNSDATDIKPQTTNYPLTNIIIIENISVANNNFDESTNHKNKGGSAFMLSGKAAFIGKNKQALPENLEIDGIASYQILENQSLYK